MRGATPTGAVATLISTTTKTLTATEISIGTGAKAADALSIGLSTGKGFHTGIRGRHKNSIARAPTTRLNHESSFVDAPNRADRISRVEAPAIAVEPVDWAGKAVLAIAVELAGSADKADWVEEQAIVPVQANSVAVAALEAEEIAAELSRESVAVAAPRAARARGAAQAAEEAVVVPEVEAAVVEVAEVAEGAGDNLRMECWNNGILENGTLEQLENEMMEKRKW
jgi:hypothetical protein